MPIFNYECDHCGNRFESLVLTTHDDDDDDRVWCPHCHCEARRLPSAPAFKIEGFSSANGYSSDRSKDGK